MLSLGIMIILACTALYISSTVFSKHKAPWGAIGFYWATVALYWILKVGEVI